jgi:polyhydroxyalkanoate synthesis repressor PhaR
MAEPNDAAGRLLEIKKYPNRRYYDATRSEHLTLEDIRKRIRDGYDVRVTDSKTGADITARVLAQIILELDEEKIEALPVALLQRLIRVNDEVIKEFLERYFGQALQQYLQYRKQVEDYLRSASDANPFFPGATAWNRALFDRFGVSPPAGAAPAAHAPGTAPSAEPGGTELRAEVKKLQVELARLQAKVARTRKATVKSSRR